jgi:hypothetical protein
MLGLSDFGKTCINIERQKKWDVEFVLAFNVLVVSAFEKKKPSNKVNKSFTCAIEANKWALKTLK